MSRTLEISLEYLCRPLDILSKPSPLPSLRHLWLAWGADACPIDQCVDLSQAVSIASLSISTRPHWTLPDHDRNTRVHLRLPEMCALDVLTLKGRFVTADVVSAVVSCASPLRSLTLDIDASDRIVQDAQCPANLQLSRLHFLDVKGPFSLIFIRAINAPKLRKLVAHSSDGVSSETGDRRQPEDVWMFFLVAHPTLRMLGCMDIGFAQRVLPADNSEPHTHLLPNLQILLINCWNIDAEGIAILRGSAMRLQRLGKWKCMMRLMSPPGQRELLELALEFKEHVCII